MLIDTDTGILVRLLDFRLARDVGLPGPRFRLGFPMGYNTLVPEI